MGTIGVGAAAGGSGTGFDVHGIVDQILFAARAPERIWQRQQTVINAQIGALRTIQSDLDSASRKGESVYAEGVRR